MPKLSEADKALHVMQKGMERRMEQQYSQSLNRVRAKLAVIYEKHAKDGVLSVGEMSKFNRLANLQKDITKELQGMGLDVRHTLNRGLKSQYEESFYRTSFSIETDVKANLRYSQLNPLQVQASIQNEISGMSLNSRLQLQRVNVVAKIKGEITQGIIQGEHYRKMASKIKKTLEGDLKKSRTIARTEGHRSQMAGRFASMDHAEIQGVKIMKVWVSALDDRTRDTHAELDGEKVAKDEYFTSSSGASALYPSTFGSAEEDINCRCSFRYEIEGFEPTSRRIKTEGVVEYKTFTEWKKNRIES